MSIETPIPADIAPRGRNGGVRKSGAGPDRLAALFDRAPQPRFVARGTLISMQGETADTLYLVISGHVRCFTVDPDGQRRIVHFARAGHVLGLSAVDAWPLSLEAVDDVILRPLTRETFERAYDADPALRREVRLAILGEIENRENLVSEIVQSQATERLYHFLVSFATKDARADHFVDLPLGRSDIGDHLGLSTETVSRGFGALRDCGAIEMRGPSRYRIMERVDPAAPPSRTNARGVSGFGVCPPCGSRASSGLRPSGRPDPGRRFEAPELGATDRTGSRLTGAK